MAAVLKTAQIGEEPITGTAEGWIIRKQSATVAEFGAVVLRLLFAPSGQSICDDVRQIRFCQ